MDSVLGYASFNSHLLPLGLHRRAAAGEFSTVAYIVIHDVSVGTGGICDVHHGKNKNNNITLNAGLFITTNTFA